MKKTTSTHLIACAVIAGAFAAGFATGPATAQTEDFKFKFAYEPADLTSMDRATRLLGRLEKEVADHCGGNRKMTINERSFVKACVDRTMQETIASFGNSMLAQAYQSRADG